MFAEPVNVRVGQKLAGKLTKRANPQSSYSVTFEGTLDGKPLPERIFHIHSYFWWDSE